MGDRVPYFLRPLLFSANKRQSAQSWLTVGESHGRERGGDREPRRAEGWRRKNWMLQTHRVSAAAALASAPAPGEMLIGFCRLWRVIGRREFGATSSCRCHWLGAICCSPCRELLTPPPFLLLGFSSTGRWASARHPADSGALGSVLSGRERETTRSRNGGGWVPAQDWPQALREWMVTGEVSRERVGKPGGRPLSTTPPPPSRLPRRVGGETACKPRVGGRRAGWSPASLRGERAGRGWGESVRG